MRLVRSPETSRLMRISSSRAALKFSPREASNIIRCFLNRHLELRRGGWGGGVGRRDAGDTCRVGGWVGSAPRTSSAIYACETHPWQPVRTASSWCSSYSPSTSFLTLPTSLCRSSQALALDGGLGISSLLQLQQMLQHNDAAEHCTPCVVLV